MGILTYIGAFLAIMAAGGLVGLICSAGVTMIGVVIFYLRLNFAKTVAILTVGICGVMISTSVLS